MNMTGIDTQAAEGVESPPGAAQEAQMGQEVQPQPVQQGPQLPGGYFYGTGRRKKAVARVRLRSGSGKIRINGRDMEQYFVEDRDRKAIQAPLEATQTLGRYDVYVNVGGGGFTGQAGAVVLGLARALKSMDPSLEPILRNGGYLTRDSRMKERKKYGLRGARRSFQFSKR